MIPEVYQYHQKSNREMGDEDENNMEDTIGYD
jgi:hypothetical protein